MTRNLTLGLMLAVLLIIGGCSTQVDMSMNFAQDLTTSYEVTAETIKDFRFERPSQNPPELREEQSGTSVKIQFDQTVEKVDEKGNAVVNVKITALGYVVKNKDAVEYEFDSGKADDKSKGLSNLIGKSYKLSLSPTGSVTVIDAKAARDAVKGGYDGRLAKGLMSDEGIIKRHEILAFPEGELKSTQVGKSWEKIVPSPKQLLVPKSYRKVYTLDSITGTKDNPVAHVSMTGSESATPAEGAGSKSLSASSFGPFAKMFDTTDDYTGKLVLDLSTGKIEGYEEKLVVTYVAEDMPANADPAKGPDTLTMKFTEWIKHKALN